MNDFENFPGLYPDPHDRRGAPPAPPARPAVVREVREALLGSPVQNLAMSPQFSQQIDANGRHNL
jgi:hypothetical protein